MKPTVTLKLILSLSSLALLGAVLFSVVGCMPLPTYWSEKDQTTHKTTGAGIKWISPRTCDSLIKFREEQASKKKILEEEKKRSEELKKNLKG